MTMLLVCLLLSMTTPTTALFRGLAEASSHSSYHHRPLQVRMLGDNNDMTESPYVFALVSKTPAPSPSQQLYALSPSPTFATLQPTIIRGEVNGDDEDGSTTATTATGSRPVIDVEMSQSEREKPSTFQPLKFAAVRVQTALMPIVSPVS